jgi:membrane fusion protein, copper/silver efflux system
MSANPAASRGFGSRRFSRPASLAACLGLAGLTLACLACGGKQEGHPRAIPADAAVLRSTAATALSNQSVVAVARGVIADTLEVPVRLLPDERRTAQVVAPAAGRIEEIFIRTPEQAVRAGERLALLYSPELVTAQREYLQLDPGRDGELVRHAEDRLVRMGLTAGQVRSLRRRGGPLERFPITSPKDGFLLPRPVSGSASDAAEAPADGSGREAGMEGMSGGGMSGMNPPGGRARGAEAAGQQGELRVGASVQRGTVLARVNDLAVVAAVLSVPARDITFLREGDSVRLTFAAAGFDGQAAVAFREAQVADTSGNVEVRAYLPNAGFRLKPGTLGQGRFIPRAETTWVLPRTALHDLGERQIAWVRDGADTGVFHAQEVRLGKVGARHVEVLAGLPPGSRVAENASLLVDPDVVVEPRPLGMAAPDETRSGPVETTDPHAAHREPAGGHEGSRDGHAHPVESGNGAHRASRTLHVTVAQAERAGIRTATAGEIHLAVTRVFRAVTQFDSRSREDVPARVEGRLERVPAVRVGEKVTRGLILAVLRSETLLAAQEEFLAVRKAAAALDNPELVRAQVGAARRHLAVLGMTARQVSDLEKRGRALSDHPILSPRDGVLLEVRAQPGQYVDAGAPLFTVGLADRIWVETWMLAAEAGLFPEGTEAWVKVEGVPGGEARGRLEHVRQGTSLSGSVTLAHVGISDPDPRMLPGMQAWVTFRLPGRHVLAVPPSALIRSSNSTMAWVKAGGDGYTPRMVKTGSETPEAVEIVEGLRAGEEVVVSGAYLLNSEWTIRQGAGNIHAGH